MIGRREARGGALDGTVQHISEAPHWNDLDEEAEKVEYASDPKPEGEERTEGVPEIDCDQEIERPDVVGQTTLEDWGWSA